MPNERIELTKGGRKVNGVFEPNVVKTEPTSAIPTVISSGQLTDQKDFDLSGVNTTATSTKGELGRFEEIANQTEKSLAQRQQERANAQKTEAFTSMGSYINAALNQPTESELRTIAETQNIKGLGSVDQLSIEVENFNAQIRAEQHALTRTVEELEKNQYGMGADALQDKIGDVERESLRKQADIAILQQTVLGKYDIAKSIADRAVDAQMEKKELELEARKFVAEKNWDMFTAEEQKAWAALVAEEDRKLDAEREDAQLLSNTRLESLRMAQANGAPASILSAIQGAKSPEEVLSLGGQWGSVDMADQQYKKIRNAIAAKEYDQMVAEMSGNGEVLTPELRKEIGKMPEAKSAQALMTLNGNLSRLKQLYETYGTWNPVDREASKRIASLRSQLEIDIAVAGGQGAISEQEADRYQNMVGGSFFQKGSSAANSIDEAIKTNDTKIKDNINFVQSTIPGATVFEPFAQFLEQKEAEEYIRKQMNPNLPSNDGEAIDLFLQNFSTNTSTPAT